MLRASAGMQHGFRLRKGAMERLVEPSDGPHQHLCRARQVSTLPFDSPAPLDLSTRYAIDSCAAAGADIERQRNTVLAHLRRKSRSLRSCNAALVDLMAPSARKIAGEVNVALLPSSKLFWVGRTST